MPRWAYARIAPSSIAVNTIFVARACQGKASWFPSVLQVMAVNAAAIADFAQHQLPQRPAAHAALAAAVTAYLAFVAYLGVGPWRWVARAAYPVPHGARVWCCGLLRM